MLISRLLLIIPLLISVVLSKKEKLEVKGTRKFRNSTKSVKKIESDDVLDVTEPPNFIVINHTDKFQEFDKWSIRYNKSYDGYVKPKTVAIEDFWKNHKKINDHNSRRNETYKRKLQAYSDLTFEELKTYRMGINLNFIGDDDFSMLPRTYKNSRRVPFVNHTQYFPPAKDQGLCGACWAFSSISLLEYMSRKHGGQDFYSEQCLIDCDEMNNGCEGGWPGNALKYIQEQGISDGLLYTYQEINGTCQKHLYPSLYRISNVCVYYLDGNEEQLRQLVEKGPVIACIATTEGFTSYESGIFFDKSCPRNEVDHAITVVGYGSDGPGQDYWIIRNSWGESWGVEGYGHFARNRRNHCGIALYAIVNC